MVVQIKDINPEEVVSGPIHHFKVGVVVGVAEGLLTHHTVDRAQLRKVVWVIIGPAVCISLLVAPK